MSWLRMILYSISRLFKARVADGEFTRCLQDVLLYILPTSKIHEQAGIIFQNSEAEWQERSTERVAAYRAHLLESQDAHNRLVDVRPQSEHAQLHSAALGTSKAYLETIWTYSVYIELLTLDLKDEGFDRLRKSKVDAEQWDEIAYEESVRLMELLRESSLALHIPRELQGIAEHDPDNVLARVFGGHFITF